MHPPLVGRSCQFQSLLGCIENEVVCSSMYGQISTTECTRYFRQCANGEWAQPQEVAIGTNCYRGIQVHSSTCNQRVDTSCSFEGIQCVDGDQNVITTQCTSHYQRCNNNVLSNVIGTEGRLSLSLFISTILKLMG